MASVDLLQTDSGAFEGNNNQVNDNTCQVCKNLVIAVSEFGQKNQGEQVQDGDIF
jgi:hypothetical protein